MKLGNTFDITINGNWKSLFLLGKGEVVLPEGKYELSYPSMDLTKWWSQNKVPAFFRKNVPIIIENGNVKHEFLTGRLRNQQGLGNIKLILTLC